MRGLRPRYAESDQACLLGTVTDHHDRVVEIQRFAETLPGGFPIESPLRRGRRHVRRRGGGGEEGRGRVVARSWATTTTSRVPCVRPGLLEWRSPTVGWRS